MRYISMQKLWNDTVRLARKLENEGVENIYGIPRGGRLVCDILSFVGRFDICRKEEADAIIDDSYNTGETMAKETAGYPYKIKAVVYGRSSMKGIISVENIDGGRLFQWEYIDSGKLINYGFDLDGVICEEIDKTNYYESLVNAKIYNKPLKRVGAIVTARREKYRNETVMWLANHGVSYEKLYMMKDEKDVIDYKVKAIKDAGIKRYIESSKKIAKIIASNGIDCIYLNDFRKY